MASGVYIKVMVSSRCNDPIPYGGKDVPLSDVRRALKKELEKICFIGNKRMFKCWINEDETPREGTQDSWDECLSQVKNADVVLCVYNGNAGWSTSNSGIGICHAELMTAMSTGAVKLRLLQEQSDAFKARTAGKVASATNKRMKEYVDQQNLFRGETFKTGEELIERALEALTDNIVEMTRLSSGEGRAGRYDSGQALDWSRLDFRERRDEMQQVLRDAILGRDHSVEDHDQCFVQVGKDQILFLCHAVPGAMGIAAAREMVGMPFLRDHSHADAMGGKRVGPVHIIACHKAVSESQAMRLLGFPDATFVTTTFGVYVADKVQQIQLLLLRNCRDEATTRHAVQRAFDWLNTSGEATYLTQRARSRARIVQAIAKEVGKGS